MNDNQINPQIIPKSFWPRHVSWLTIALAVLSALSFMLISDRGFNYITPMMGGGVRIMETSVSSRGGSSGAVSPTGAPVPMMDSGSISVTSQGKMENSMYYPYPYPYPNPDVPITDTREFLKVYYNASIQTRNVQEMTRRVETVVKGYDGRIDSQSSSEKYGYVSFAMPQVKYNMFRSELESLVGSRFITINISSQNLLSQKVSIEEQQKQADTQLSDYKTARQKLVSTHTSNVKSLQSKIDEATKVISALNLQTQTPQILAQIQSASNELAYLKKSLDSENASYTTQLGYMDSNIKYAQDYQKAVQTQDKALLDNVATVSGTISIQWISLWDMVRVYLPGLSIPIIFAVLSFLSLLYDRKRFGTV